jgi:hypothetical protein
MSVQANLWSAKLPSGEVRAGTIEQLGEAFRAGHVSEATLVCAAGSTQWARLVDVLGAMTAGAAPQAASAPPPPAAVASVSPAAASMAPSVAPRPLSAAPAPIAPAPAPASMGPDAGADVWQVKLPDGQTRSGTRHQLEEAFKAGHLDSGVLVLASGAKSWVPLGALMQPSRPLPAAFTAPSVAPAAAAPSRAPAPPSAAPPTPATAPATTWQVRMPDGQVRAGTPEQLEEAVRAGHLDASTMVLPPGAPQWVSLPSALEGIANARSRSPSPVAPVPAPAPAVVETPAHRDDVAPPPAPASAQSPEPTPATVPTTVERQADATPPDSEESKTDVGATADEQATWQVKLTAAQLAAAFQAGIVHGDTQVMETGTDQWVALSSVASG